MSDWLPWGAPYTGWAATGLFALLGLWIALSGIRGRRPGYRQCPKCHYDLSHSPTSTCSECGHTLRNECEGFAPRRRLGLGLLGLVVMLALPTFVVQYRVRTYGWGYYTVVGPLYWVLPDETLAEASYGRYRWHVLGDRRRLLSGARYDDKRIEILKDGRVIWSEHAFYVSPGKDWDLDTGMRTAGPIQDIDLDGTPELIFETSAGGNGGSGATYVFRLGESLEDLNPHAPQQSDDSVRSLIDVDHDGRLELLALDHSFVMWNTSHAGSIYGHVILRLDGKRYRPAPELMRTTELPITPDQLSQDAQAIRQLGWPPRSMEALYVGLLDTMVRLIYSGHSPAAYRFCDQAWPGPEAKKQVFLTEFRRRLTGSSYRATLEALGHPPLTPAAP